MKKLSYLARLMALSVLLLGTANVGATPTTLLSVTGNNDTGLIISGQTAAAAAFTFGNAETNVSISADIVCFSCNGGVFLMDKIGAGTTAANIVSAVSYSGGSSNLFSGLNLSSGTFYLVVANNAGSIAWAGSTIPLVALAANVSHQIDFFAQSADFFAPSSSFSVAFSKNLHYTITRESNVTPVPAPASLWLILAGGMGFCLRRQNCLFAG